MNVLRITLLSCFAFTLFGCDKVSNEYPTYSAALEERLFIRGWLPDIIPKSSKRIKTSNDLDINISSGEFYFDPIDSTSFTSNLEPISSNSQLPKNLSSFVAKILKVGLEVYLYSNNGSTWVFACHNSQGFCKYEMKANAQY